MPADNCLRTYDLHRLKDRRAGMIEPCEHKTIDRREPNPSGCYSTKNIELMLKNEDLSF